MTPPRVALATCSSFPQLEADDALLIPALAERGVTAEPAVWDDASIDWNAFDLVVVRSTWDYSLRQPEFVAWAQSVPRLANPAEVLAWNTNKFYLRDLERVGVPVVPTIWLDPARNLTSRAVHTRFPASGEFVVKPTVSAGARDTGRYQSNEADQRGLAIVHARDLLRAGRHVMVQPYLKQVDTIGETGLVYIDGVFSHSVRKGPLLQGPSRGFEALYKQEDMSPRAASEAERTVADAVMAALPTVAPGADDGPLLYARVDLIPDADGAPMLLELELAEPSLFLLLADGADGRVADAIAKRVGL
ncbi:MAG: ATP-grasp domain-containing protein [Cellulomonas sp.]